MAKKTQCVIFDFGYRAKYAVPNAKVSVLRRKMMWICPNCGGTSLRVVGRVVLDLIQEPDGNFQTMSTDSDHEWDEDSFMWCRKCNHDGPAKAFYRRDSDELDESMDGDHESALASAGFGTDEDYGGSDDRL